MASEMSNRARVGEAFELLAAGLEPFVSLHMAKTVHKGQDWAAVFAQNAKNPIRDYSTSDPSFLLRVMVECWNGTFERQLPRSIRNLLFTLRDKRNEWAHNKPIQTHDAQFTLSGVVTLLEAIDAREVDRVRVSLDDLTRAQWEKVKAKETSGEEPAVAKNVVAAPTAGLAPWREVIHPHDDVRKGTTNVAEFAADLELVRLGEGKDEYRDPRLFFDRTYLTAGLRDLLTLGLHRIAGTGGQPVVNCQTNFGGGKTHSLIALYHLFSGVRLSKLPAEIQALAADAGIDELPAVKRAVVVGNRFAPGESHTKDDGTVVNTIWGEIAWQLGGPEGYALVAESDRLKTNPGDGIRKVLAAAAPCLVLVDEWVAYARELYERGNELPGGSFESQFGFAQALTEATRGTDGALLVVSIPASDGASDGTPSATTTASDLEVGGVAGRAALAALTNVVTRQAEHWQPAKGDESFEIVRRRLFQPLSDASAAQRDATAEAFGELYRANRAEFPSESSELAYVERIKTAYPIHPEVFDRLYEDWSTVERFQRTRGVLRLMAATISSLWESDDRSPLILPCSLPLADSRVQLELAGKLPDYWAPVIDGDIDGPGSRAADIDKAVPVLGSYHATRRVARTIFLGATPTLGSANRGIEIDRVRLGSVFAGEKPGFVADALNRLAAQAPHLYVDRERYWFDRQQNVNRTARDEAARLLAGDRHEIHDEIVTRLKGERGDGDFRRVHIAPATSADVADDPLARLVVLGPEHPHIAKGEESPALASAREILDRRGNSPRQYRNMLLFAACDQRLLDGLEQAVAEYLAWSSICERVDELVLDTHQVNQARNRQRASDDAVGLRLADAYKHALVPRQDDPVGPVTFDEVSLDQQGTVAQRVSRKLTAQDALRTQFPPVLLRMRLDDPSLLGSRWADGSVPVATLWEDFAKYIYLPRLRDQAVLLATVRNGPASTGWQNEGYGVAVGRNSDGGRYLGLVTGMAPTELSLTSLVVRPAEALAQLDLEEQEREAAASAIAGPGGSDAGAETGLRSGASGTVGLVDGTAGEPAPPKAAVFRGTVSLDPNRPVKGFGDISKEVLDHLASQVGADIEVRVEIVARKPDGFPDHTVRTVTENARTLKFDGDSGFSEE